MLSESKFNSKYIIETNSTIFTFWVLVSNVFSSAIKNHDDDAKKYAATGHNKRSGGGGSALSGLTSRLQRQIVRHLSTLMYTKKEVRGSTAW